ncbi:DUF6941 family protein [Sulfobacillus harzensis]|uniref:Uncharacterized protein n=1 Tax=Sulfobacillus harzensis TaxID=2729629 RepID=A0A7Y0Q3X2_9FIRM|nr:hypothetical protein [Sulfobacillus harzensis]NMP23431.1 hypothetical protein [Sulfobacillus harzensis]
MRIGYFITAEYASVDNRGRPIIVGVFDQLIYSPSTPSTALVAVIARIEDVGPDTTIHRGHWRISGPGPEDYAELPVVPGGPAGPQSVASYVIAGFGVALQQAGTMSVQLEINGKVIGEHVIPVVEANPS